MRPAVRGLNSLAAGLLLASLTVQEQAISSGWPERPVRIITTGAGSSPDAAARVLAEKLSERWKRPVVVENRPGAGGILAVQGMMEARDGHTLMFGSHSVFTVNPLLYEKLPYDPVQDVTPISLVVEDFLGIVVASPVNVGSLGELADVMRTKPGDLNFYAVPGSPHLLFLAWQKRNRVTATFVNYRTSTNAIADLTQGRIHIGLLPLTSVLGSTRAGTLRLLVVTNTVRSPASPETPTAAEAGFPELTLDGLLGLFGPKDMPDEVRFRIAEDIRTILRDPDAVQKLTNVGLVARGTTPLEFADMLAEQRARWAAIAREHDVKPGNR